MKMKHMLPALLMSLLGSFSYAQSAPAAAVDGTVKVEKSAKKTTKKHAHKVSSKKHKTSKHKAPSMI
jgi:Skp family chaperone for outer membrane proteins